MRARHICTSFPEVRVPALKAALKSARVAESRSMTFYTETGLASIATSSGASNMRRRAGFVMRRTLPRLGTGTNGDMRGGFRPLASVRFDPRLVIELQQVQQLLNELVCTACVHGALFLVLRVVEDSQLLRSIGVHRLKLLSEDSNCRVYKQIATA